MRILLEQFLLVFLEVIKLAVVILSESVLGTENISAFASHFEQTDFLVAAPALVSVRLKKVSYLKLQRL